MLLTCARESRALQLESIPTTTLKPSHSIYTVVLTYTSFSTVTFIDICMCGVHEQGYVIYTHACTNGPHKDSIVA